MHCSIFASLSCVLEGSRHALILASISLPDAGTCLQGLSLNIPAGSSCALVGTSGSGKSTVLRLLFRFYEPDSGTLSIAGRSIADYTMKSLRSKIGEVHPLHTKPLLF